MTKFRLKCKNCKFWEKDKDENYGYCNNYKKIYNPCKIHDFDSSQNDFCQIISDDWDGYLTVGANFGCIHFVNKDLQ